MEALQYWGFVVSVTGLFLSLYAKLLLDKKHYSLEMLREWNQQTAKDRMIIDRYIPEIFEECNRDKIAKKLIKIHNAAFLKDEDLEEGESIDKLIRINESMTRLLNYFEFVSSAYLNNSADKGIIHRSFTSTMMHYYCVANDYIGLEYKTSGRNPWLPYSIFIKKVTPRSSKRPILLQKIDNLFRTGIPSGIPGCCLRIDKKGNLVCAKEKFSGGLFI